jgi:nucleotide-binding universal stress UspA family protein
MKSMLVLIGGGQRDQVVFQTALAAAKPLSAHLDCLHIHVTLDRTARDIAIHARGSVLRDALTGMQTKSEILARASKAAADNIRDLCARSQIELGDRKAAANRSPDATGVTASFREETETEDALESLILQARNSDVVVMGRARQTQGLPQDTLEGLILRCGRPMLLAGAEGPKQLDTIMVCWKKSDNSARAVAAAVPLLSRAKRLVFTTVMERDAAGAEALNKLAQQHARDNVQTDVKIIPPDGRKIPDALSAAAEEYAADLVVMGAYGRTRALKFLFGSCTESLMKQSDKPILLLH